MTSVGENLNSDPFNTPPHSQPQPPTSKLSGTHHFIPISPDKSPKLDIGLDSPLPPTPSPPLSEHNISTQPATDNVATVANGGKLEFVCGHFGKSPEWIDLEMAMNRAIELTAAALRSKLPIKESEGKSDVDLIMESGLHMSSQLADDICRMGVIAIIDGKETFQPLQKNKELTDEEKAIYTMHFNNTMKCIFESPTAAVKGGVALEQTHNSILIQKITQSLPGVVGVTPKKQGIATIEKKESEVTITRSYPIIYILNIDYRSIGLELIEAKVALYLENIERNTRLNTKGEVLEDKVLRPGHFCPFGLLFATPQQIKIIQDFGFNINQQNLKKKINDINEHLNFINVKKEDIVKKLIDKKEPPIPVDSKAEDYGMQALEYYIARSIADDEFRFTNIPRSDKSITISVPIEDGAMLSVVQNQSPISAFGNNYTYSSNTIENGKMQIKFSC